MGFGIWKKIKRGVSRVWNAGKKVVGKIFGTNKDERDESDTRRYGDESDDYSDDEHGRPRMKYGRGDYGAEDSSNAKRYTSRNEKAKKRKKDKSLLDSSSIRKGMKGASDLISVAKKGLDFVPTSLLEKMNLDKDKLKGGLDTAKNIVSYGGKEWKPKIKKTKKSRIQQPLDMDAESAFRTSTTLE